MTTKCLRLALAALFLSTPFLRAAIPPAENLLPADTLAFFAVPDCASARLAAKSSPGWLFWGDAAMKPFHDRLVEKWSEQLVAPLEHDLGVKVSDFTDLPQGQLTLAITVNGSTGHDDVLPGLLLLLDAKDQSSTLKTNLATLVKNWTVAGRALRTEQIHGVTFTVVPLSSNDFAGLLPKKTPVSEIGKEPEKPAKPGEIYISQFESLLVVGNSVKVVEPVAAHLTGGSVPAIADNAQFAADKLSQFREHPEYYGWFNGKSFFDLLNQAPVDTSEAETPSPLAGLSSAKTLGLVGLGGLKSASFALRESHEGMMLTLHLTAPEAERSGLLKILALPPKDAGVPPFVPADAVKFSRVRLDGKQTWAELQRMIAGVSPNGQASLNAVINIANSLGQQKTPGFDIRNDLFGNLNDDIISYQKPPSGDSLEALANPPTLYLIAVSNPDAMINAITTITSLSNPQAAEATPREFLGRKIHSIPMKPTTSAATGLVQPHALYASACSGYLALSTDSAILEEFLRNADGQNKTLRDNPGLASAVEHLGGTGGGLFGYENQRETMRGTFKAFKNIATVDATLKMFPPSVRTWLDFSLLPDYDAVSKYFYVSTFAGTANADGLTFKVYTPRPPQLN
jgi:hypothetical protein